MAARLCETYLKRHVVIFLLFVCFVQICAQFKHPRARTQTRPGVDYITAQVCFAPWCHQWLAASTAPLDKRSTIRNICIGFPIICQQMTVTHPHLTSALLEQPTAHLVGMAVDCMTAGPDLTHIQRQAIILWFQLLR